MADIDTSKKNVRCNFLTDLKGCPYSSPASRLILILIRMFNINSFYLTDVLKLHYWGVFIIKNN